MIHRTILTTAVALLALLLIAFTLAYLAAEYWYLLLLAALAWGTSRTHARVRVRALMSRSSRERQAGLDADPIACEIADASERIGAASVRLARSDVRGATALLDGAAASAEAALHYLRAPERLGGRDARTLPSWARR